MARLKNSHLMTDSPRMNAGTFSLNKNKPIHRWYPYLEGYSFSLIEGILQDISTGGVNSILDPFCGSGTTSLVASAFGIKSWYCETNPFMRRVIEAKINSVRNLRANGGTVELEKLLKRVQKLSCWFGFVDPTWDGFEKYFEPKVLCNVLALKKETERVSCAETRNIAMVLLASVLVRASKMIRQGDLRFAKIGEKKPSDSDIVGNFAQKLEMAIDDIKNEQCPVISETSCLGEDCRAIVMENGVDCVITSPPYLNGTNYARNVKLEMKLFDFITSETDLSAFHSVGIIAGINNVSKRNPVSSMPDIVRTYVRKLEPISYDARIPLMVAGYFRDMDNVIGRLSYVLKNNGILVMDIGDSQFAGVHIPTHKILAKICESHGFTMYENETLRERKSKNGMLLTQRLLKFKLSKKETLGDAARNFTKSLPYKCSPYSGRNWGHPWHSLCSYHGKLKPAIAHFLVDRFTKPGDVVLDPLCGVGTIPLEACLQGRIGVGNDLSELAFCVSMAKLEKPNERECREALERLEAHILKEKDSPHTTMLVKKHGNFGFNGKLTDYFHLSTLREILCAREFFKPKIAKLSPPDAMILACLLHVLHGNRPYALSRNSHPLTPYFPTGSFIYKNIIHHVREKMEVAYAKSGFDGYTRGRALFGDFNKLPNLGIQADSIICSPPFAGSIRFYMQNWMRLWLCGWEDKDFRQADDRFIDRKQQKGFDVYESFFKVCHAILKPRHTMILHLGRTAKFDMAEILSKIAAPCFTEVHRASENMRGMEKHGVRDKGSTIEHQYLFLERR